MNEILKPGDRVRLLNDVCRGAAKGALGTVAEVLDGVHGPRYGVELDCNEGRVTTDVSAREVAAA
jgi:hypothetical protein